MDVSSHTHGKKVSFQQFSLEPSTMMQYMEEDSENCLLDHNVNTSVCVSSPSGGESSMQPMPDMPRSHCSTHARKPQYNRNTIKIEDFLPKSSANITAKEYRVLIPTMFQTLLHPNKELSKTKVKGLWECGNRPHGWPDNVKFRDPNNQPKFQIWESKLVFTFLKEKLCEFPKYQHLLTEYTKVKQESKKSSPGPKSPKYNIPNIPSLQSRQRSNSLTAVQEDVKSLSLLSPVSQPSTSQQSSGDVAYVQQDLGVKLKEEPDELSSIKDTSPLEFYCSDTMMSSLQQQQPIEVVSTETMATGANTMTSLTLLQNATVPCETEAPNYPTEAQHSNVIVISTEDSTTQPIAPQSSDIQPALMETTPECVVFAKGIQENLLPTVVEFSKTFEKNLMVLQKVEDVIKDTFVPIFNVAKCSKTTCADLSKLGSRLQEMLKRFSFMNESYSSDQIIDELDALQKDFKMQEIVFAAPVVPDPANEVLVMTAMNKTTPSLVDPSNPYIPTIADLEARARQKAEQLEDVTKISDDCLANEKLYEWKDNTKLNLMSPMCKEMEGMNLEETETTKETLDPEEDYGIKLTGKVDELKEDSAPLSDMEDIMKQLDFLNGHNNLGIEVRPVTTEEQNDLAGLIQDAAPVVPPPNQAPVQVDCLPPPPLPPPVSQQTYLQTSSIDIFQMSLDNNGFQFDKREDQAVEASLQAAYSMFRGSMVFENPPIPSDEVSYITDDVLSMEEDFRMNTMSSFDCVMPVAVSSPTSVQSASVCHSPQQQDVLARLQKQMGPVVIPTTVLEAAEAKENNGSASKRAKVKGKTATRRNSDYGSSISKGKGRRGDKRI